MDISDFKYSPPHYHVQARVYDLISQNLVVLEALREVEHFNRAPIRINEEIGFLRSHHQDLRRKEVESQDLVFGIERHLVEYCSFVRKQQDEV